MNRLKRIGDFFKPITEEGCVILLKEETELDKTLLTQPGRKTNAAYKAAAEELLATMDRLDKQMDQDRAESEHLKMEAQVIKAETQVIKAKTEVILAQLQNQIAHLTGAK